ncbi:hypothetical protein EVJ58_g2571 [Rhodofomes roseus]|uniref:Uncharacterized protein n=1 Tax=Rhodofomes roseus TaxID=34475 RepID=A0A4Y9YTU9_9APHY|nr:hypothetical protein EVJ58_g2571 [Rhodofomes roseus]
MTSETTQLDLEFLTTAIRQFQEVFIATIDVGEPSSDDMVSDISPMSTRPASPDRVVYSRTVSCSAWEEGSGGENSMELTEAELLEIMCPQRLSPNVRVGDESEEILEDDGYLGDDEDDEEP